MIIKNKTEIEIFKRKKIKERKVEIERAVSHISPVKFQKYDALFIVFDQIVIKHIKVYIFFFPHIFFFFFFFFFSF